MLKKIFILNLIISISFLGYRPYEKQKYWIFFKDKGFSTITIQEKLLNYKKNLPEKVLRRRLKTLQPDEIIDISDLPLYQHYLNKLQELQIKPIVKSKWLNAVSANLSSQQVKLIKKLPFVLKIQPVIRYIRRGVGHKKSDDFQKSCSINNRYNLDYGNSFTQNNIMRVPELHQMGITGTGVLVGMLDTGFSYKNHEAFSQLQVIAEYDFINNDNVTENEMEDSKFQHDHGTKTLSVIAGFQQGQLIGPAYNAKYMLAKTEVYSSETIIEEDYWVAGIEWMEKNGVDVVNSSLGYDGWYNYSDFDGNTAITTVAADLAVKKGIVVVVSMGNEGNQAGSIIAPADGDSVISVGAVYGEGQLVSFSSIGPTYDGRIKPDVVAMGSGVTGVNPSSTTEPYTNFLSGTSFASPLTAGVAALILSAHPYLNPIQVKHAIRNTADNSSNPNNDYGWGLVNAYEAIYYHGLFFSNLPVVSTDNLGHKVKINIFSQKPIIRDSLFIYYSIYDNSFIKLKLTASAAENEYQAWIPEQLQRTKIKIYFSAIDETNDFKKHPYDAPGKFFTFFAFDSTVKEDETPELPSNFTLYQNYPNPFNSGTKIKYDIFDPHRVNLVIYNATGQLVKSLMNQYHFPGSYSEDWDCRNDHGVTVSSGVYFYKIKVGNFQQTKKMLVLR